MRALALLPQIELKKSTKDYTKARNCRSGFTNDPVYDLYFCSGTPFPQSPSSPSLPPKQQQQQQQTSKQTTTKNNKTKKTHHLPLKVDTKKTNILSGKDPKDVWIPMQGKPSHRKLRQTHRLTETGRQRRTETERGRKRFCVSSPGFRGEPGMGWLTDEHYSPTSTHYSLPRLPLVPERGRGGRALEVTRTNTDFA